MKHILALTLICAVIIISSAFSPEFKQEDHSNFKAKNLKVLPKNISHDDLDKIMDGFKFALGVKCNHCHASQEQNPKKLDFASDAKPEKETARNMMRMTAKINKKYFNATEAYVQVECQTCHRGKATPEIK